MNFQALLLSYRTNKFFHSNKYFNERLSFLGQQMPALKFSSIKYQMDVCFFHLKLNSAFSPLSCTLTILMPFGREENFHAQEENFRRFGDVETFDFAFHRARHNLGPSLRYGIISFSPQASKFASFSSR